MFETSGCLDKAILLELKRHLLAPKRRVILWICLVLLFLLALFQLFLRSYGGMVFSLCGILFLIVLYEVRLSKAIKLMLQRWAETEGLPAVSYTTSFEQDSIRVRSHTSGANTAIKYEVLVRFVDTKSVYALFTAARQFAVVFKGSLDAAQRAELIAFLKEKPTKIKW